MLSVSGHIALSIAVSAFVCRVSLIVIIKNPRFRFD
jgi:hypothetical protein